MEQECASRDSDHFRHDEGQRGYAAWLGLKSIAALALQVFQAMRKHGLAPSDITYSTAIVACWKGQQWRQAVELLNAMRTDGFAPNMITVSLVIDTLDRCKKHDVAVSSTRNKPRALASPEVVTVVCVGMQTYVFESSVVGYVRSENYEPDTQDDVGMMIDLHGYCKPVARAALRAGLKRSDTRTVRGVWGGESRR
jgi:pentatricopeptide repeat protein